MLDNKQIRAILLLKFKMGRKAAETPFINKVFGPGAANECTVQRWFKKFCKEDESLEDEKYSGWPSESTTTNWEHNINKLMILKLTWEVAQELNIDHSKINWHLKRIGKVKKLDKWVPHELTTNQKRKFILKCCLLLFYITAANHFSIGLWHAAKSGFYTTTGDN